MAIDRGDNAAGTGVAADTLDATKVLVTPVGQLEATNAQAALAELDSDLTAHVNRATAAHAASAVSVTPTGNLSSTNAQAALAELDSDLTAHANQATAAHAASAVSVADAQDLFVATNVEAALSELHSITGGRNLLVNGGFRWWQRGYSFTSSTFAADNWHVGVTGSLVTFYRVAAALGLTSPPDNPVYYAAMDIATSSGSSARVWARGFIEDVRVLSGRDAVLTFWARANDTKQMSIEFAQQFGSGGSGTVDSIGVTKLTLTTTWQRFVVPVTMPSIAGKTLGTTPSSSTVTFWFSAGSDYNARTNFLGTQTGTFYLANVQWELGRTPTPFERRSDHAELLLCQRYYEKSYDPATVPGTVTLADVWRGRTIVTGANYVWIPYKVVKAYAPAITLYNPNSGASGTWRDYNAAADVSASTHPTLSGLTALHAEYTSTASNTVAGHWVADASL